MKRVILAAAVAALSFVGFAAAPGLSPVAMPDDYTLLASVASDGHAQYVDTGYVPKVKPAVVCDMKILNSNFMSSNGDPFGTDQKQYGFDANFDKTLCYRYGNSSDSSSASPTVSANIQAALTTDFTPCAFSNEVWIAGTKLATVSSYDFSKNPSTLFLFRGIQKRYLAVAFSYVKIYDDGELVRDYLPCKDPSGAVGLWDCVEGNFRPSAAAASLVASEEEYPCTLVVEENLGGQVAVTPANGNYFGVSGDVEFVAPSSDQYECQGAEIYELGDGGWTLVETKSVGAFTYVIDLKKRTKVVWKWKLGLGMESELALDSSAFGSSEVAATVTGIGETASKATLTFHYGTASNALDGTVEVSVTDAGVWRATIPHLISGTHCYVKATLSNDVAEVVASDVFDFVQPEFVEDRGFVDIRDMPEGYIQMERLAVTGKEWVQTDFLPTQTTAAEFSFGDVVNAGTEATIFGQAWSSSEYLFGILYSTPQFCFFGNGSKLSLVADECDYFLTIEPTSGGNGSLTLLNKTDPTRDSSATVSLATDQTAKLKLFGLSATGNLATDRMVTMTFYSLKFWKDGELAADYVPAYEVSSDTAGLCDLKGGRFYPSQATAFAPQPFVLNAELKPVYGRFEVKVAKAGFDQIVTLYWGETYGGTNEWASTSGTLTVPAGATTVSYAKPNGWGSSVWFARVKVSAGDDVCWSKTLMAEPPAPLGMDSTLALASSAFGSSEIAATVTGIGKTASEATLVFEYGTASNALDRTLPARVIDNAGAYEVTIPHLIAGTHCYVKATLSNDVAEVVTSDVFDFVQPEVEEDGIATSESYAQQDHLVAFWDGLDNVGVGLSDRSATTWADLTGHGFDWTLNSDTSRYEWTDRGLRLKGVGLVGAIPTKAATDFDNKITTVEFVYANKEKKDGIIFGPGYGGTTYLYTDAAKNGNPGGHVGFYGPSTVGQRVGTTAALNEMNCYSIVYTRTAARPTGVKNFWVNGVETTAEAMSDYWGSGLSSGPILGDRSTTGIAANGELFALRIYDIELADAEREQNRKIDDLRYFQGVNGALPLEFQNGQLVVTAPASDSPRTVYFYAGESYGGIDGWGDPVTVALAAGATTVSFPKPEGWGSSVWFARVKVSAGDDVCWSKTLMPEPPAPLGMSETLVLASSAFGSSEVAATVTGIGKTASSATLTFDYGTTPDCSDGSVEVDVTDAGEWRGTIPHLAAGKTYYVKATLENVQGERAESEVFKFVQPEVKEDGVDPRLRPLPEGYVQMEKLTSTGQEYVLIDYWKPDDKTSSEVELGEFATISGEFSLFGQKYDGSQYLMTIQQNVFKWYGGGDAVSPDNPIPTDGTKYQIKIDALGTGNGDVMVSNRTTGVTAKLSNKTLAANGSNFVVFSDSANKHPASCSLYSFKAWKNGEISIDLVPAYKTATGKAGLIDLVTGEFRVSATTTAFAKQPYAPGTELIRQGDKLVMELPVSDVGRTVSLYAGEAYGGTNGWGAAVETVQVAAGETTVEFDLPASWGASVWFARAKVGEGDGARWTRTLVAADANLPSVSLDSLDGLGGDTMVVKGTVESLGGTSCTLKVYTGTSEDAITEGWTNLDGDVRVDTGDFTLTLRENDTTAPRYLNPGETYFVRVVATSSNGKVAWSSVMSVKMAGAAAFSSASVTYAKRVMTVTTAMSDLGMTGETEVQLWVGADAGSLAMVTNAVVTKVGESFTLSYELPLYETPYVWQLKAVNTSEGETKTTTAPTSEANASAPDSATYTWTGEGADNRWANRDNWSDNKGGDCLGYPQSANATAVFSKNADVEIDLPRNGMTSNISSLNLGTAGIDVRFHSADTNACGLVLSGLAVPGKNSRWTLDHAFVRCAAGCAWAGGSTVVLTNGACLYINNCQFDSANATVKVLDGSWLDIGEFRGGNNGLLVVSNATVNARGHDYIGYNAGAMTVRFEGTHPKWRHTVAGNHFRATKDTSVPHLDFFVPVGGYQSAPYEAIPSMTVKMGNNGNNPGSHTVAVNVLPDSPAARVDEEIATPLVIWPSAGINTAMVVEGTLPTEASGSAFVWGEGTAPTSLAVTIVGSAHKNRLTVAGEPEAVLGDKISPSYGHVDDGTSRTLTATPGLLTIDEGARRATCTGWKLYDIDPATQEPAGEAVESGEDVSYAWETANKWQRFAWQWNIESKVNVSAEAGGTAATSADWVTEGETATLTATPADESWRFWKWTGDVPEGHDRDNPLVLTVDQAKNVVAVFGHVRYVSTTGDDNSDGTTTNTAFATVKKALAGIADGDEVRILEGTFDAASNVVSGAANASAYVIANDVRIVGAGRDKTILTANHLPTDTRLFQLNNAEAVLSSLTLSNVVYKDCYGDNGHGVLLSAGKVFDCTFRNFTQTGYYATGAGIHVDGADTLVSNCVFNTMTVGAVYVTGAGRLYDIEIVSGGSGNYGVGQVYVNATGALVDGLYVHDGTTRGLTLKAGTVQNALVCRQTVSGSDNAGVTVNGKDAVLRYATVVDCLSTTATDGKDGIQQTLGLVEYSISARNGSFGSALVTGGTFRNNLTDKRVAGADASCLVGDPQFTDAANGDYTLQLGSLAQDAADDASVALDLVRTPRPQGAMSDFGCYERTSSGGALQIGFKVIGFADALTGGAFAFLAVVDGDTDGIAYAWYVDGSDTASGTDATFSLEGAANGKHTVKLVVTNGKGGRAELEKPDVVEVHPKTVYVSHAGSAEYPYDDPAKAASSLADAIAALWSGTPELCTIDVAEGLYTNTALVNLNFPVQILGAGSGTTWVTTTNTIVQVFGLADEQARLEGLTVTNVTLTDSGNLIVMSKGTCADVEIAKCKNAGNPYSTTGGAFYMSGGVVTNCAVRGLDYKGTNGRGAAIYAADGLVVDTVVENGSLSGYVLHVTGTATFRRCTVSGYPGSAALIVTDTASPLFDSCRFFRNASGSTMCTLASSAKMVNCEIFGNVNTGTGIAGLSVAGSAVVDHCTVTGNRTQNDTSVHGGLDQTGGTVVHSIFYDNAADGGSAVRTTGGTYADNVDAADPKFADVASDDYRLTLGSPAIDVIASGDTVETDMEGLERPMGAGWDCGAHEFDPSTVPFGCGITVSQKVFVKGSDVPVSGVAAGSTEETSFAWYVDGDAEPVASGADVVLKGLGTGYHSLRLVVTEQGGARRVAEATAENAFELRPSEVWVSKTGASEHPYDTPAAAATNLQDALDALWAGAGVTGFVHIAEGVYTNTAQVALAAPIRLAGAGIDRTVFTGKLTSGTSAFHILDDGASIDGITIKGFASLEYGGEDGAGLSVKAGVGRNVRVTECVRTKAYSSPGGGVFVGGTGVLLDSVIDGNEASSHWGNGRGAGLYQDGGRVERCRIVDNEETSGEQGGGVYLKGGVLANALILSNKTTSAAGVWQEGGTMINCTVADNIATKDDGFQVVSSSGKSYNNLFAGDAEQAASIADAVTTNGNVVAASEAVFTNRRSQPYRLKLGSPAVNAGDNAAVEACALTTDMDGHDRIWLKGKRKDATADAGCYEFSYAGTVIIVR